GKVIPVETRAWIGEWNGEKSLFCLSKDLSAEQESLQKFNKMFENNPALMTVSNYPEMKFLEVNEAFIKGTGYTREEVLGKTTGSLEMMAVGGKFTDIAEELQRKKRVQNIEVVLKTKNGELRNGIFSAEMVETQGKTYVLTVMIDITERKKAEMEVSKAVETKSEFVSMVSHELRTPLAVITESVKIVFDGSCGDLNTEQKDYLEVAVRNIDRLGRLINDVLFVQKLEAGMLKFNLVEKDINLLIQTTLEPVKSLAEKKGLAFEIQSGKNIPPIKMDSDKMEQVLLNLMSNALKFTDKGKITVVTEKEENYVKVSFIDTGIGIKKEDLNKLFGKFEQIYTGSERKSGGTGLGLAISKEIIISHKGKIWAESEWGKGTKFSFTLPLK
ncbi:MAG: PAS domain-containing sensor histidine kinase, partial [Candidatus Firestonebacteria bacterium]